ncbi:MAG TPA: c-type cytochrome [Lacunisphaera sp.]|nr:c-type cytochrome [Lacunisphaera sp.]
MLLRRLLFLAILFPSAALFAQNGDRANEVQAPPPSNLVIPPAPVRVAEEALKTLQVVPGYRVEIAAADPLVGDPVAITFGPDGRMWVVEMRGFMPNPDGKGEDAKVGTVATLEDTDHDGRYDKRTVFLDGLVLPRAVALVGDGVLVAEPPHLWFCRDTNGDGVSDSKVEVASDYGSPGNPEHTANGLYRAMDNWIYSANHNARYRYRGNGRFEREVTVSRGQWGICQDDAGRLFHNNNSDPLRYDLVPSQYFARNPGLTDPDGLNVKLVPADLRVWPVRVTPGINRGYQSLDSSGRMTAVTAACGPLIYRGDLLPDLEGSAFIAEPSGNLIKRIALEQPSDALVGRNAYEGFEFIASTDERFRPVNLADGPDGALYVVDMYRGIIQHRIYLTTYLRKQIEERGLADGLGMGRIYRVVPARADLARPAAFNLATESSAQLVGRLGAPNGWIRDTAQRLLVERRDPVSIPLLRSTALNLHAPAHTRLHALWTLEGVDGLDQPTLLAALSDPDATICAAAIRLGEKSLAAGDEKILAKVIAVLIEPGLPVPYPMILQGCLSLGESHQPRTLPVLLELVRRHGVRPAIADAVVSSLAGREVEFIQLALKEPNKAWSPTAVALAAACVWRSGDADRIAAVDQLFGTVAAPAWARAALLKSYAEIIPKRDNELRFGRLAAAPATLTKLATTESPDRARAAELLAHLHWPGHGDVPVAKAKPLTESQQALFEKGRTIFNTICAGCHQPTGLGLKGLAPSLVDSKWVGDDARLLARIVLQGKASENLIMPPLAALDDESLAGALTFIRRSWGHGDDPVDPAVIAQARQETAGRTEPWSDKLLTQFAEEAKATRKSD